MLGVISLLGGGMNISYVNGEIWFEILVLVVIKLYDFGCVKRFF